MLRRRTITSDPGRSFLSAGVVAVLVLSAGCRTIQIQTDWDREANFSQYKTFQIKGSTGASRSLSRGRLERALASILESKGLRQVSSGPDLYIYACVQSGGMTQPTIGYSGWRDWAGIGACTSTERDVSLESLVVDIVSAARKQAIWRGVDCDSLEHSDHSDERVRRAVAELLKTFPPRPGDEFNPLAWMPP
jgi:hypothetical protein